MVYKLMSAEGLINTIDELDRTFSAEYKRYIPPENYDAFIAECMCLATNYDQASQRAKKSSWGGMFKNIVAQAPRDQQSYCIVHLASNLKDNNAKNRLVLLGAIFYRLLRIYQQQTADDFVSFLYTPPSKTKLYPLLCDILKIPRRDLPPAIDSLTLYDSLRAFQAYANEEKVRAEVENIKDDVDFDDKLQELILLQESEAKRIKKDLNVIVLLQQFSSALQQTQRCMERILMTAFEQEAPLTGRQFIEQIKGLLAEDLELSDDVAMFENAKQYLHVVIHEQDNLSPSEENTFKTRINSYCYLNRLAMVFVHWDYLADASECGAKRDTLFKILDGTLNWGANNRLDFAYYHEDKQKVQSLLSTLKQFLDCTHWSSGFFGEWDSKERLMQLIDIRSKEISEIEIGASAVSSI